MVGIQRGMNAKVVLIIANLVQTQRVILQLVLARMGVKQDGSVTDVILTVM